MPSSDSLPNATPDEIAGCLLAARRSAVAYGLPSSSVEEILAATGANRERAHEAEDALIAALSALGPALVSRAPARNVRTDALTYEALGFVMQHPGCAPRRGRARYSACYRQFVLELRRRYADVRASEFAEAISLPLGMLANWMRGQHRGVAAAHAERCVLPRAFDGSVRTPDMMSERRTSETSSAAIPSAAHNHDEPTAPAHDAAQA